jgi:hypothetical protein
VHRRRPGGHRGGGDRLSEDILYLDAYEVEVAAPPEDVWAAIEPTMSAAFGPRRARTIAWLLGCDDDGGFRVGRSEPPRALALEGRHRFSRYRLTFEVEPHVAGSRLRAVTHAEFPGLRGRFYRALVVGSGGHRIVTTRLLKSIAHRAERAARAPSYMAKEER